jgi:signal transduction histidine kinase
LSAGKGCLQLTISDNGTGMPPAKDIAARGGVGVAGMRFRVEQFGGEFRIASGKGGTTIVAKVPLARVSKMHEDLRLHELVSNGVSNQVCGRP